MGLDNLSYYYQKIKNLCYRSLSIIVVMQQLKLYRWSFGSINLNFGKSGKGGKNEKEK